MRISTATRDVPGEEGVDPPTLKAGPYVVLTVEDTGLGMEPEVLERVFEPFFTSKEAGEGTGLGLATTYGIVTQHDGDISARSRPGAGTSFRILLPRVIADEPTRPGEAEGRARLAGPKTVLLVEDEPAVRAFASRVLSREGFSVIEGTDGEDALSRVEALDEPVDLLLSDLVMPGMGGLALSVELTRRFPLMRVLFMSGYSEEMVRRDERSGDARLLQKPFTGVELLGAVDGLLKG